MVAADRPNWEKLREAFGRYARGRAELLEAIGVSGSNRDPLVRRCGRSIPTRRERFSSQGSTTDS